MGSTDHGSAIPLRNYGDTWKSGNPGTRDTQFPGIPGGVKPLCISTVYLYGVSLRCISTEWILRCFIFGLPLTSGAVLIWIGSRIGVGLGRGWS